MIEFNEMLYRRLSKVYVSPGRPSLPKDWFFNQSLWLDWPPTLFAHTVEYPRPRACIHKEGRRIFRVGKPVTSLLSFLTLRINIMTIQPKNIVPEESKSIHAGIDVGAEEFILLVRKNGVSHKSQKFTNTPADRARLVKKMVSILASSSAWKRPESTISTFPSPFMMPVWRSWWSTRSLPTTSPRC